MEIVALIIIGLNNKNLESDIGVNGERSGKQSSQPLVLNSTESSEQKSNPVPMNLQTEQNELQSPPALNSSLHPAVLLLSPSSRYWD